LKNYIIYTPFEKKNRILAFSNENVNANPPLLEKQQSMIKSLAAQTNQSSNPNTWNDDVSGALISKAKLN
jgi:hypothetical protein